MPQHILGAAETLLKDGEMRAYELENTKVLLARVDGTYYAVRGTCTHYGGPLAEGAIKDGIVMCPWHHACFDVRTGKRTEPPALADVPSFPVTIENGQVAVTLERQPAPQGSVSSPVNSVVIIGGGAAGNAAAEELRRMGYAGSVTILSASRNVPVDRPNLSKDYMAGRAKPEWIPLHDEQWYADQNIDLRLNTEVRGVDTASKQVKLASGESVAYDRLLIATGGIPRQLPVEGHDLANVFTLRTLSDADAILQAAENATQIVIVGASFIGMEVAASLKKDGVTVTVVGLEDVPFAPSMGEAVGRMLQKEHEANGVQFRMGNSAEKFVGENGRVTGAQLKSGETLPADLVIVGVGVRPATGFLKDSGLQMQEREGSLLVDEYLQTSSPDVYAAGDIARYATNDQTQRIEHWRLAEQHGVIAAHNMLGQRDSMNEHVPFFWTNQWGAKVAYVGHASGDDTIVIRGQPEEQSFIAFYLKDGQLAAAAGSNHGAEMCAIEFILRDRMPLTPEQMRDESFDLVGYATGQ